MSSQRQRDEGKRNLIVEQEERLLVNKMRSLVPVLECQMFSIKTRAKGRQIAPKGDNGGVELSTSQLLT